MQEKRIKVASEIELTNEKEIESGKSNKRKTKTKDMPEEGERNRRRTRKKADNSQNLMLTRTFVDVYYCVILFDR